mgnify:CR=1 FL=1
MLKNSYKNYFDKYIWIQNNANQSYVFDLSRSLNLLMEISLQTVTRDKMIADKSLRGTGFGMTDVVSHSILFI